MKPDTPAFHLQHDSEPGVFALDFDFDSDFDSDSDFDFDFDFDF